VPPEESSLRHTAHGIRRDGIEVPRKVRICRPNRQAIGQQKQPSTRPYLANVDTADFLREVEVLENGMATVLDCVQTVMEEEFWHNRYAQRDLAVLEQTT
jgi:hypothetical protein